MRCVPLLRTPRDPLQSAPAEMVSAKDAGEQVIEPLVLCTPGSLCWERLPEAGLFSSLVNHDEGRLCFVLSWTWSLVSSSSLT